MTLSKKVLKLLSQSRHGMMAGELYRFFDEYEGTSNDFHVNLHSMKRGGFIWVDGKRCCDLCNTPRTIYRITDKGRIHLNAGTHETCRTLC